jgi:hypothetical protein
VDHDVCLFMFDLVTPVTSSTYSRSNICIIMNLVHKTHVTICVGKVVANFESLSQYFCGEAGENNEEHYSG